MAAAPRRVREIAWKAQARLCDRFRPLLRKDKLPKVAATAVACELSAFIWANVWKCGPRSGVRRWRSVWARDQARRRNRGLCQRHRHCKARGKRSALRAREVPLAEIGLITFQLVKNVNALALREAAGAKAAPRKASDGKPSHHSANCDLMSMLQPCLPRFIGPNSFCHHRPEGRHL